MLIQLKTDFGEAYSMRLPFIKIFMKTPLDKGYKKKQSCLHCCHSRAQLLNEPA